jgi:hypothetical protein
MIMWKGCIIIKKKFLLSITETYEKQIEVNAENSIQAEEIARDVYFNGDEILDKHCFSGVDFSIVKEIK